MYSPCFFPEVGGLSGGEGGGGVCVTIVRQHFTLKVLFNEGQRSMQVSHVTVR